MNKFLDFLNRNINFDTNKIKSNNFVCDDTLGISLFSLDLFSKEKDNILILASNLYNAQSIYNFLKCFYNNIYLFASDEYVKSLTFSSSKELLCERLNVLYKCLDNDKKIIIAHPASFLKFLPSAKLFKNSIIKLKVNEEIDIKKLVLTLINAGYYKTEKVSKSFEFSKRGDIVDIYCLNEEYPIRISLFDNVIESIKKFDPKTQRSISEINESIIIPATDFLLDENERKNFKEKINNVLNDDIKINNNLENNLTIAANAIIDKIENSDFSSELYKYFGFIQNKNFNLLDYFNPKTIIFSNFERFNESSEFLYKEGYRFLNESFLNGENISHLQLFYNFQNIKYNANKIIKSKDYKTQDLDYLFNVRKIVFNNRDEINIIKSINNYLTNNYKIIFALNTQPQISNLKNILKLNEINYDELIDLSIPDKQISITRFYLSEGFDLPDLKLAIITSKELFNITNYYNYFSTYHEATVLKNFDELKPGDYIVHEQLGIGKFIKINTILVDGIHRDFINVKYDENAEVNIPLNQFHLIKKYSSREGYAPKLSNLSTDTWKKLKDKIKSKISNLADRLKTLYKNRSNIEGYSFKIDDEMQTIFDNQFPYKLTLDQEKAYQEIKADMEKNSPMDRLLCGDVGFGKTEVAFRAIFKCINNHKMAILLAPTTILARQHYELAKIRFAYFNIKIAIFSRLIPLKKQKEYLEEIKEGKIDLIIGTHRILNKNFSFNNLGLLVIDEEQKFGVEHKERIKEIKSNIDVLSLSATPIPRTLQMSLFGIREISLINTAPKFRNSIQTYVAPFNISIAKDLIERELARKGQIYYIHNNTHTINEKMKKLKSLIPNLRVGIVHGKMDKEEIENVMLDFYNYKIDLLLATSIVENGLDVPRANLIIVENADLFGLSELYQIKGRVGRSNIIAYAYLFYNPDRIKDKEARERLKAIQEFTELGSGYKIAQKDLLIRGAGNILGKEQAGFIDSVGIELYLKLIKEATSKNEDTKNILNHKAHRQFDIDAYFPKTYVNDNDKLELYNEIEEINTNEKLEEIREKLKDIYGTLPKEVENILLKKKIDLIIESEEFKLITETPEYVFIYLHPLYSRIPNIGLILFEKTMRFSKYAKLVNKDGSIKVELKKVKDWVFIFAKIIEIIHDEYLKELNYENR